MEDLLRHLEQQGYKAAMAPVEHLEDLRQGIQGPRQRGLFDDQFYEELLTSFEFQPPDTLPEARSLIAVAAPDPQVRIAFTWGGELVPTIVPPTYLHWREGDKRVEDAVTATLAPNGYRVALANVPKKLTAVRSGLADYGKNNVSYVPGLGSFHRLAVLWSDLPCEDDTWHDLRMMQACQKCKACLRGCPTGAITSERFLIRAERCLTFSNEKPSQVAFPEWIDPSWHNCLVGCLRCQRVCPENKDFLEYMQEGEAFSEAETALLLQGAQVDDLPASTVGKLERLDLVDLLDVLPRNLSALFCKEAGN